MKKVWICGLTLICLMIGAAAAWGQSAGDYRSKATGNWNSTGTWEYYNGSAWVAATSTPTSSDGVITILNTHTVTVTANVNVDQVTIDSGGQISVNTAGVTLTVADGPGTDLTVNGTLTVITGGLSYCYLTLNGSMSIGATGTVTVGTRGQMTVNGSVSESSGGDINITGGGGSTRGNVTVASGGSLTAYGTLDLSLGQLTMNSNGTGSVPSGGAMTAQNNSVIQVDSGGTLSIAGSMTVGSGSITTLTLNGTVSVSGTGNIAQNQNTTMTFNSGSTLKMGPNTTITGTGTSAFTLASSASIEIGSTAGITSTGSSGNIQVPGTRTYNTGANYTYNGTAGQVTGNGLPATVNNLTINNSAGVTLTANATVSSTLSITSGWLTQGNAYNLTAGTISISSGAKLHNYGTGDLTVGAGGVSNNGTIDFKSNGGSCGGNDDIQILSSQSGTQRSWTGSGTFMMVDLYVKDQGGTASITCYSCTDSGGNGANWTFNSSCTGAPTAVKLISFSAVDYDGRILLQWRTGQEVDNLGFHLYREEGGQLYRLTPELVAGSAFLAGSGIAFRAGRLYHWWDNSELNTPNSELKYWLQDVDLNGKRIMHGPVVPVVSNDPLPQKVNTELLSEFGIRVERRFEDFWRIQDLKERLSQKPLKVRPLANSLGQSLTVSGNLEGLKVASITMGQPSQQDREMQWFLASGPAVKLSVKEEGWYRVGQPELVAAGLSSKINPRYLQLFVDGKEQAIRVMGESDKRFDPQDGIEFYGVGLDTASTDRRVYWLVVGSGLGKRIQNFTGHGGQVAGSSFRYTVERKDRVLYVAALKNGDTENFFGPMVTTEPVDQLLSVIHLDRSQGSATLEVALQGFTQGSHQVAVLLNNIEVGKGKVVFEGQFLGVIALPLLQSQLLEGENLVTLESQGGEMDVSLIDHIRLTYWHTYAADNDTLKCTVQGGKQLSVTGFSDQDIRVIDITNLSTLLEVIGAVKPQGPGYSITFMVPGSGQRSLLIFSGKGVKHPITIAANKPSTWHETGKGADLVMISHGSFMESLGPLETLREGQGRAVALIDVEDLYDEFNFGHKSPQAVKDFLLRARTYWRKAPGFVLFVGDASVDPRNYLGLGDFDFVPTKLIDTGYMETASDDWFVDFDGDGIPEMAIGRLPIRTIEEATTMVSKITDYERTGEMNEALFVADLNDGFNFEAASAEVEALLPANIRVKEIFRGDFGSDEEAKQQLLGSIDQGPLLVNYIGHGSEEMWRGLFTSADAGGLINGLRLSFFISMTCLNGFFHDVYNESLAEALLKADKGGAVAVWASSGLTELAGQVLMNKELVRLLFNGEHLTIGEATAIAKEAVTDMDIRRTWILFGDPTIRLKTIRLK